MIVTLTSLELYVGGCVKHCQGHRFVRHGAQNRLLNGSYLVLRDGVEDPQLSQTFLQLDGGNKTRPVLVEHPEHFSERRSHALRLHHDVLELALHPPKTANGVSRRMVAGGIE